MGQLNPQSYTEHTPEAKWIREFSVRARVHSKKTLIIVWEKRRCRSDILFFSPFGICLTFRESEKELAAAINLFRQLP